MKEKEKKEREREREKKKKYRKEQRRKEIKTELNNRVIGQYRRMGTVDGQNTVTAIVFS